MCLAAFWWEVCKSTWPNGVVSQRRGPQEWKPGKCSVTPENIVNKQQPNSKILTTLKRKCGYPSRLHNSSQSHQTAIIWLSGSVSSSASTDRSAPNSPQFMTRFCKTPSIFHLRCPSPHASPVNAPDAAQEPEPREHLHSIRPPYRSLREFTQDRQASLLLSFWLSSCRSTALLILDLLANPMGAASWWVWVLGRPQPPLNQGYNRWRLTFQTRLGQFESSLWGWPFSKPISLVIWTPSLAEAPSATQMEFYLLAGPESLGWEAPCGGDSIASKLSPGRWKSEVHDIQTRCPHAAGESWAVNRVGGPRARSVQRGLWHPTSATGGPVFTCLC